MLICFGYIVTEIFSKMPFFFIYGPSSAHEATAHPHLCGIGCETETLWVRAYHIPCENRGGLGSFKCGPLAHHTIPCIVAALAQILDQVPPQNAWPHVECSGSAKLDSCFSLY